LIELDWVDYVIYHTLKPNQPLNSINLIN